MARRSKPSRHAGVLLVDKPLGPTSHDVVGWVRWALDERSVGHCGTLDPAASGLLVICVGEATKLVELLTGVDKSYRARFVLGRSTTTADAEGETLAEAPVAAGDVERAAAVLGELLGPLMLPPPAYSAVKLAGKRAHELARAGETLELAPRPMAVHSLEILARGPDWLDVELTVAKGTYVRSLAEELGRRLDLPVHLGGLRRLACGGLRVDDAVGGLVAARLPTLADDRRAKPAPRWRIDMGEPGDEGGAGDADGSGPERRRRASEALLAGLEAPWTRLPCPVTFVSEEHASTFERLLQGQKLGRRQALALGLEPEPVPSTRVLIGPGHRTMVIAQIQPRGQDGDLCLAPARVIRLPASGVPLEGENT
ncbi:MAG: tRNA pseudouridine(55) synthase TruB [Myxococcales bacterium]|nr:tRNA pseudouridine(55) synthase TruB [Myxococcales bacterium]